MPMRPAVSESVQLCAWGTEAVPERARMAKRQLAKKGIAYEALDNGILSCADPERLQRSGDSLGRRT